MSSKERVRRAMASGPGAGDSGLAPLPDRVPVFCQLAVGHYFLRSGLKPLDVWFRSDSFAEALVRLADRYRFDGILVNLPGREPQVERFIDHVEPREGSEVVHWRNGCMTVVPHDDNPHYFQPDGTRYFPKFEEVDPETLHYVEPWDVTDITYPYTWGFEPEPRPTGDFFPPHHLDTIRSVLSRAGNRLSVHSEVFSPFSQFLELLNYESALLALLDDPGKSHACLEALTRGACDLASQQAACGVDAVLISSAFSGAGLISREHYAAFVLPYEKKLVTQLRARHPGVFVYTHTCGAIGDRLDLMLETATQGVDTLDPPPLGTVDLAAAKAELAGKAFIKGNMDPVNTILWGTEERVRTEARGRLEVGKPGGGYILSTACSVAPRAEPANILALSEAAQEHGRY